MHSRFTLADARTERALKVLNVIYRASGMTRSEVALRTGLGSTATLRLVSELLEVGLLTSERKVENGRGRPSDLLRINPEAGCFVGVEFGRGQLTLVAVDAGGTIVYEESLGPELVPAFAASDETVRDLAITLRQRLDASGVGMESVKAVGLALHDIVNARGEWLTQQDLYGEPFPIAARLTEELGLTVIAEDVSRAFALAERKSGAARSAPDCIYLFVGKQGVGSGIFVNGSLLRSSSGVSGELGHVEVLGDGERCACGNRGCLETVATHSAVIARFEQLKAEGVGTTVGAEIVDFAAICNAASRGDKAAYLVLEELARHLGRALSGAINVTGASHVVVGGQLALAGNAFLNDLESELRKRVLGLLGRRISVAYAQLPTHAGAWGVAVQALEAALERGTLLSEDLTAVAG